MNGDSTVVCMYVCVCVCVCVCVSVCVCVCVCVVTYWRKCLQRTEPWSPKPPVKGEEEPTGGTEDGANGRGQDTIETCWDPRGWKDIPAVLLGEPTES